MSWRAARRLGAAGLAVAAALLAGVWIGARSHAAAASQPVPGSAADPLVTRSYVTKAMSRVLAQTGGHVRTLAPGAAITLRAGTMVALLAGSASVSLATAATPSADAAPAMVDLTAGAAVTPPSGASAAAVPTAHLLVAGGAGDTLTAGSAGAAIWVLGHTAAALAAASAG